MAIEFPPFVRSALGLDLSDLIEFYRKKLFEFGKKREKYFEPF